MAERLFTLQQLKDYLDITTDGSDAFLTRLIDAASQFVLTWIGIDSFGVIPYTQNFIGSGTSSVMLFRWPVQSITSVGVAGVSVPASTFGNVGLPGSGYVLSDRRFGQQTIQLYGYNFWGGAPSQVIYTAGFQTSQTSIIAAPTAPATTTTITPTTDGQWISDNGVTIDGVDAVKVTADPAAGQYAVDEWGNYIFAGADATKTAVISYDYVPFDVSFSATELAGEWYKRKDRLGVVSKTLGGQETITFSQKDMSDAVKCTFQPYVNVVPM